jgi:hypothetical protein
MMSQTETTWLQSPHPIVRVRGGFTLIELCLGMLITTMICGAVSAFLLTVSHCWTETDDVQSAVLRGHQFATRLEQRIRDAKRIGYWRDGASAGFIFWQGDTNGDGAMQSSELGVVQYDSTAQTVDLYTLPVGAPDAVWTETDLNNSASIALFITGLTPTAMVRQVTNVHLTIANATSQTVAPSVQWQLCLAQSDGSSLWQTCQAALRGPATVTSGGSVMAE